MQLQSMISEELWARMIEVSDNLDVSTMWNKKGFSCVNLWFMINFIAIILGMHQSIFSTYKNQNNIGFDPSVLVDLPYQHADF